MFRIWFKHEPYQTMYVMGVARIVWDGEAAITDSNLALTKRKSEEAKFVQETSQGPDISLGGDGLPAIKVDHFRGSV